MRHLVRQDVSSLFYAYYSVILFTHNKSRNKHMIREFLSRGDKIKFQLIIITFSAYEAIRLIF